MMEVVHIGDDNKFKMSESGVEIGDEDTYMTGSIMQRKRNGM